MRLTASYRKALLTVALENKEFIFRPRVGGLRLRHISTMLSGFFPSFHRVILVGGLCQCGHKMAAAPPDATPEFQAERRGKGSQSIPFEKVSWNLHL